MKRILLAISFVIAQHSLHAQPETPPGFLWQVEINGSEFMDNFLSVESKTTLAALFKGEEETLQRLYGYEGWLLNMSIMGMLPKFIDYEPKLAVDRYFHDFATEDKKPIYGLDDIEALLKKHL